MDFLLYISILNSMLIIAIGGASSVLTLFIIPIIRSASSTRTMVSQFAILIHKGMTYLQTGSRTSTACFLLQSIIIKVSSSNTQQSSTASSTDINPSSNSGSSWKTLAICGAILLQVAWYEIVFVFPTNDRMVEIGAAIDAAQAVDTHEVDKKYRKETLALLDKWAVRNVPRFVIPLAAGWLALYDLAT